MDKSTLILEEHIQIKARLSLLLKKQPLLIGSMNHNFFKLTTVDNPPMEIEGTIHENEKGTMMELQVKYDSIKSGYMGLLLGLSYPIIFVVFLISVLNNPTNIWLYFWTLISIPVIYYCAKVFVYLNYPDPDLNVLLKQLSKLFEGEITEKVNDSIEDKTKP